jgi:hypothetical protein
MSASVAADLSRFKDYLVREHRISSTEYTKASQLLDRIDHAIASLPPSDAVRFSSVNYQYRQILSSRNPDAWKTDVFARALIAVGVISIFGVKDGLLGVGCALVLENGFKYLFQGISKLAQLAAHA